MAGSLHVAADLALGGCSPAAASAGVAPGKSMAALLALLVLSLLCSAPCDAAGQEFQGGIMIIHSIGGLSSTSGRQVAATAQDAPILSGTLRTLTCASFSCLSGLQTSPTIHV